MDSYDAGLLNDFGGGDVEWWQDYIRAELNRAEDFYRDQFDHLTAQLDEYKTANQSMHNMIMEIRKHFNAWDTPTAPTDKDIVDCVIRNSNRMLAERDTEIEKLLFRWQTTDAVNLEQIKHLKDQRSMFTEENAALREEVERLESFKRDALERETVLVPQQILAARKQMAQDILLDTMITTFIAPDGMIHKQLRKKFGLEG